MGTRSKHAGPAEELSEVRRKISELVARNAVPMEASKRKIKKADHFK
jgi:hypothetical protein